MQTRTRLVSPLADENQHPTRSKLGFSADRDWKQHGSLPGGKQTASSSGGINVLFKQAGSDYTRPIPDREPVFHVFGARLPPSYELFDVARVRLVAINFQQSVHDSFGFVHILSLTTPPTRKTARFCIQDKGENTGGKKLKSPVKEPDERSTSGGSNEFVHGGGVRFLSPRQAEHEPRRSGRECPVGFDESQISR